MCIIVVKNSNIRLPEKNTLRNCFENNPDGAGFAYTKNGTVKIEKGFLTFTEFYKRLEELKNEINIYKTPMLFHFRIGTAGQNSPENTHPYPIKKSIFDYKKLDIDTDVAVVHNGILPKRWQPNKENKYDLNDTQIYINKNLFPYSIFNKKFYLKDKWLKRIEKESGNKFAFLDKDGNISIAGDFKEKDGVLYSNGTYLYSYEDYKFYLKSYDKTYSSYKYEDYPAFYGEFDDLKSLYSELVDCKKLKVGDVVLYNNYEKDFIVDEDEAYYFSEYEQVIYYVDNKYITISELIINVDEVYTLEEMEKAK